MARGVLLALLLGGGAASLCYREGTRVLADLPGRGDDDESRLREAAAREWNGVIEREFRHGRPLADTEKLMAGKFRDRGVRCWGGSGRHSVYFLLDDFHQLRVNLDKDDRVEDAALEQRLLWLKYPDGEVVMSGP